MQNRFPHLAIFILALGLPIPRAGATSATSPANSNRWPDQKEVEKMFEFRKSSPINQHVRAALAAEKEQNFRKAIQEWNEVLRLAPQQSAVFFYRGNAFEELGDRAKAIADLNEFVRRNPKVAAGWARRGIIHADSGDTKRGLSDCNQALKLEPRNAFALALRADIYRLDEKWDAALRDADRAINLEPGMGRAYQVKGRVYFETKRYADAVAAYTKVMQLSPNWPNGVMARGDAYAAAGNYRAALADFRAGMRRYPNSPRVHDGLAWFLATCPEAKWRDGPQAVREATQACEFTNWKDGDYIDTLAVALAEAGDFEQAIRREEQAIQRGPKDNQKTFAKRLALFRQRKPWHEKPAKP